MGFNYSYGRRPPSDPQCIPVASFKESHGLRVAVLCPERHLVQDSPRSPSAAPPRPAPSLSEHCGFLLAGALTQEEAMPSCTSTRGPQPAFIRHNHCRWPAHTAHESDSSQPSFVCHHPWDTIMIQAETIALAGLVNSLHASRPAPRSLRYQMSDPMKIVRSLTLSSRTAAPAKAGSHEMMRIPPCQI
ncbi:hypothetical protein BU25DRAFT_34692 [Macroventuria anomochaeta]|uniref:Uncharacterized protein n=1 Tax=Macroventuria anomochaeta TaxID=301207 RepID=A0ACB6S4V0_9PLEO|nr:uncharacterized protein BU25DRAFT_34692 [Macroventuria anomochaeta]KAF2628388.1 hypothetical protein BU25DRAFT_34692 [Macroventuria anomochaeta]